MDGEKYVSVDDAAAVLKRSPQAVRRMLRIRELPGSKIGGVWYVDGEALYRQFSEQSAPVVAGK